MAYLKASVI